jgi:NDP-sugar pyrophosphorylase family protein
MKAMLLAAGEGARLRPLTEKIPKPMLTLGGRPILESNVRLLAAHGGAEIAINLHHQPQAITEHFGDGSEYGVRIRYSHEPELLGTAGAVKALEHFFDNTFYVLYGDNFTDCDLGRLLALHRGTRSRLTMALFHRENAAASGIAQCAEDGRILKFVEKPRPGEVFSQWVNAGALAVEPGVLAMIPREGASDFGRDIVPALLGAGERVHGYKMTENLVWIDSPEDYRRAREAVERRAT